MSVNSRFAIAVHTLVMLGREACAVSSSSIAASVNTNPVTIRKVLGSLNHAGLISTVMGADGGAVLAYAPEQITLLDIYRATEQKPLFAHHPKPPNQQCHCGRQITPVLDELFNAAESAVCTVLQARTLADVIRDVSANNIVDCEQIIVS